MDLRESGGVPEQSMPPAPSPTVWPPPPIGISFSPSEAVNTSGMKGDVPPEIARLRWNWGAFCLPFLWCINHKLKWGWSILALTAALAFGGMVDGWLLLAYLGAAIYLGLIGHSLGWQNRRFEGRLAQYFSVQRRWAAWGLAVVILSTAFIVTGLIVNIMPEHSVSHHKLKL